MHFDGEIVVLNILHHFISPHLRNFFRIIQTLNLIIPKLFHKLRILVKICKENPERGEELDSPHRIIARRTLIRWISGRRIKITLHYVDDLLASEILKFVVFFSGEIIGVEGVTKI